MKQLVCLLACVSLVFAGVAWGIAQEKVELRVVLHPFSSPTGAPLPWTGKPSVAYSEIFPAFQKLYPNVRIVGEEILGDTEGRDKYLLECRSGNPPDILQIDGFWAAAFASANALVPLDNFEVLNPLFEDYFDSFLLRYKGKTVALVPTTAFNSMLWYRKDLFEKAGLSSAPADWNDLKLYAQKLTDAQTYGIAFSGNKSELTSVTLLGFYWQGDKEFITADNIPVYDNQVSIDLFNLFKEMYQQGWILPEIINMGYEEVFRVFVAERVAMMLHGSWLAPRFEEMAPNLKGKIGLAPNPVYPVTKKRGTNAGGWALAITSKDPAKHELCAHLIGLLSGLDKSLYKAFVLEQGALPVMKSLIDDSDFAKDEWSKIIMDELQYAKTRPVVELYPDASLEWSQAFQETILGKDAEEALREAVKRTIEIGKEKGFIPKDFQLPEE